MRPLLILVSGAPASGKSTLACSLASALGLPLLSKDLIKEALLDTLGAPDRRRSVELSAASYATLNAVVRQLLTSGVSLVVDCNYHRGRSEPELRPIVERARAVLIHCQASQSEVRRRYVERATTGSRHPGHHDAFVLPDVLEQIDRGIYEPLDLAIPTLRVDTTHGYQPDLATIRTFAETAGGGR